MTEINLQKKNAALPTARNIGGENESNYWWPLVVSFDYWRRLFWLLLLLDTAINLNYRPPFTTQNFTAPLVLTVFKFVLVFFVAEAVSRVGRKYQRQDLYGAMALTWFSTSVAWLLGIAAFQMRNFVMNSADNDQDIISYLVSDAIPTEGSKTFCHMFWSLAADGTCDTADLGPIYLALMTLIYAGLGFLLYMAVVWGFKLDRRRDRKAGETGILPWCAIIVIYSFLNGLHAWLIRLSS
jgi:hypothetical protein